MKSSVTDLLGNTLTIAVNQTAIAAITGYQKYLSPRKGFSCAYRVLHDSDSCSQHIKRLIAKYGIIDAIPLARKRLKACKNAYIILKSETEEERQRRQNRTSCQPGCDCKPNLEDCCTGCDGPDCDVGDCG
ncbi:membrane protein insertion efficiency factor YidD [Planktothrix sp. FACHB-1365]|uniref:membrane protein insertion efficiency factor YidD n=1 Tax=Planktothrix sp. FACHB-1365 TaxID=2692855 RepID=UPI001681D572|nr:membrane protein insertion efficiency factor YidD [Planktothrix sp. FACHB-1365]MBD2481589.1 membrane protein insertion efficiency factor YidD [Planktothrix sp. FACHB-1365]